MHKIEWGTLGMVALWVLVLLFLALIYKPSKAQDNPNFGISTCYTRMDVGAVFSFSNIPDNWLSETGWYFVGNAVQLDDHTLKVTGLQFDEGYSYAIVGTNDYSENVTAATDDTPLCGQVVQSTPELTQAPVVEQSVSQPVVSTGRTCAIQYPKIILVCNG